MATPQSITRSITQSEALQKLEEQLTCSICLEQYTNPKLLPCFHSFCLDCLRGVQPELTQQGNSLPCPTCRSPCQLPQQGIDTLPPSFTINNLTEVYNLLNTLTGEGHTSCESCGNAGVDQYCKQCAKFMCQPCLQQHNRWIKDHKTLGLDEVANAAYQIPQTKPDTASNCSIHSEPIKIFCETCEELICYLCTVKKHKDHDYDVVNDAYTKHKQIIEESSLRSLDQQILAMTKAQANLVTREKEIAEQGENAKQRIHETIAQIKELLDQTEIKMNEEIFHVVEYKMTVTDHQKKEGEAVLGQLTEWRDHIQQSLKVDTPNQVLSTKAQIVNHTKSLLETVKEQTFQPIEQANLRLVIDDKKSIEDIPSYIGTIEYSTPAITTSFDHTPIVGQESAVNVALSRKDGSPASIPLSLVSCNLTPPTSSSSPIIQCSVEGTSRTGQYHVIFTPSTGGFHQLHVKLHDRIIPGNPVSHSIPVHIPVTMKDSVVQTITGLKRPYGVAVSDDGQVFVTESKGHCITILTRDGEKVRSFGSHGNGRGQLTYPTSVAVTSKGTLLVVDNGNHRIQEFTMDGEYISCVGNPPYFNYPYDIAINKTTGQVYVNKADTSNYAIQARVLSADLTVSHVIGSRVSGQGQFSHPLGVAIDSQGFVYVADSCNHRIQKFTPKGQFESSFGSKGLEPGQLSNPLHISIDNDLVYVSEGYPNHRISVYTTTLQYVHCFGKGSLQYPHGSVMDPTTGYLYVCDDYGVHMF